jgi:hypothetical protein
MNIKSLEKMEAIVKKQRNLSWDGWDVVSTFPNPRGWSRADGVFIKGRWFTKKVYPVTSNGWDIPDKILG